MVSFRLSTKYMWGLRFKWNGELVDLNKMLHEKFHSTKPKFFHLFQLMLSLPTTFTIARWTSHTKSLEIRTLTILHKGG
jgi:hypothetical protein